MKHVRRASCGSRVGHRSPMLHYPPSPRMAGRISCSFASTAAFSAAACSTALPAATAGSGFTASTCHAIEDPVAMSEESSTEAIDS